jgi:hypothetical protein
METEAILKFLNKQKSRHSLTLKDGRVIKGGDTFEAPMDYIPVAFRDMVTIVSAGESLEAQLKNSGGSTSIPLRRLNRLQKKEMKTETGESEELVEPIEEVPIEEVPIEEAPSKEETKVFKKKHIGGGKYNVLDDEGSIQNEKPLTGMKAQQLIDILTAKK